MPTSEISSDDLMTSKETCERLRISMRTLYSHRHSGLLPSVKLGRKVLFRRSAVEALITKQTQTQ